MFEKNILQDGTHINTKNISQLGKLFEVSKQKKMFCFTIEYIDGTLQNIENRYNDSNRMDVKEYTERIYLKIKNSLS